MKFAQLLLLVFAFFVITPAKAGVLIEPVLGYNFGKFEGDNAIDSEKFTGPAFGGRLGYQNLGFQLGVDYLRSTLNIDDNSFKEDLTASEWAGFVGFEFPVLLRVYAGYIFSAQGETEVAGSTKLDFNEGSGMKFGVGFTGLPFVDINFEYRKGSFAEYKLGGTKVEESIDYNSFMVGISLPFVL